MDRVEKTKLGQKVFAVDPETGQAGFYEVVFITSHPVDELIYISIDGEMMKVTPDHPIFVDGRGWVEAENVTLGDRLRRKDGGWVNVLAIERVVLDEPEWVYNFTVAGVHTYFVLEVGVLVHNCGEWDTLRKQYNIPENATRQSISDVKPWAGDERTRIWLGTRDANGIFNSAGGKQPFTGRYQIEGKNKGFLLRSSVVDDMALAFYKNKDWLSPGKILGGMTGEGASASFYFKGNLNSRLTQMMDYTAKNNGEIMFVLHGGVQHTKYTMFELNHILSDKTILAKTKFIIDWHY